MLRILISAALLSLPLWVSAQINRPNTKSASSTAPPATGRGESAPSTPTGDGPIAVKQANGIEIKLMSVTGNAADQQVTLNWLMNNPKANTDVVYQEAYAVDTEGDEYSDAQGWNRIMLYTDVPKKAFRILKGVPSKVKMLRLAKFNFWTQATNATTVIEFRDLKIDWK